MTRKPQQSKKKTAKARGKASQARKYVKAAKTRLDAGKPVKIEIRPIGGVGSITIDRAGKTYVHHFKKAGIYGTSTPGLLVIQGNFKVGKDGFIRD